MRTNVSKVFPIAGLVVLITTAVLVLMTIFSLGFTKEWVGWVSGALIVVPMLAIFIASEVDATKSSKTLEYLIEGPIKYQSSIIVKDWKKGKVHKNQVMLLEEALRAAQNLVCTKDLQEKVSKAVHDVEYQLLIPSSLTVTIGKIGIQIILDGKVVN